MFPLMLYPYNLCCVKQKYLEYKNDSKSPDAARKNIPIRPQLEEFALEIGFFVSTGIRL
jgi:hypothetical protein